MFHCSWKHRCLSALRPPLPWSYSIWPRLPHHVTCFFQTPVTIFTLTEWIIPVFLYFPCIRFSALPIILPFYPPSIWHLHAKRVIITPANTKPCFIPSKLPCFLLKVISCSECHSQYSKQMIFLPLSVALGFFHYPKSVKFYFQKSLLRSHVPQDRMNKKMVSTWKAMKALFI